MPIRENIHPGARRIVEALVKEGHEAYIVGGAVRDLLLGLHPKDYDIATSATPEEVRGLFGRRARIIGRRFRIVHVYDGNDCFEVSTFRREPRDDERKGRETDDGVMLWRDNAYGTLEEDARRRDFTVNSLYYDVHADPEHSVVDHVGGLEDLRQGRVRATVAARRQLEEDPVRILRALKLVGQYEFQLADETDEAVRELGDRIALSSRARLFEEILKILGKPYSRLTFEAFYEHGFLDHLWPNFARVWESSDGDFMRALLSERDRQLAARDYTHAKTLMIATLCLASAARAMGSDPKRLWEHEAGLEPVCRDAVVEFMKPFPVPRFLSARARDVLLLLPRFVEADDPSRRLQRHPEYKYARELFLLWGACAGLPRQELEKWPAPPPGEPHHRGRRRSSRRSRGGRRRKGGGGGKS